ncbi:24420_t:CDS:2, partial [Cetraspora pellucida]
IFTGYPDKPISAVIGGCGGVKILRELNSLLFNNTADEVGLLSVGNGERSLGGCGGGDKERRRVGANGGDDDAFGVVSCGGGGRTRPFRGGCVDCTLREGRGGGDDDDVVFVVARAGAGGGTGDAFEVREGSGGTRFGNAGGVAEIDVSTLDATVLTRFFGTIILFDVTGGITKLDARLSALEDLGRPPGKGGGVAKPKRNEFMINFSAAVLRLFNFGTPPANKPPRPTGVGRLALPPLPADKERPLALLDIIVEFPIND